MHPPDPTPRRGPGQPRLAPGEETVIVRFRAPEGLLEQLDAAAAARDQTRSEALREAVELWLEAE